MGFGIAFEFGQRLCTVVLLWCCGVPVSRMPASLQPIDCLGSWVVVTEQWRMLNGQPHRPGYAFAD